MADILAERSNLRTVPRVEVGRYLGKWYEIARFPNFFQKDCDEATAEYSLRDDGRLQVVNTCRRIDGRGLRQVIGIAEVADSTSQAKLKVSFLPRWLRWTGIGKGDYWIIDLAEDYSYAVVSEPNRKYLWILCREPVMSSQTYDGILKRLRDQKFDLFSLIPSREGAHRWAP
ncbi:MAG: lipocalin family protein, partial [Bdellovibrionota bacterium]